MRAIGRSDGRYTLAGILARGSLDSTLLAAQLGVPYFTRAGDVQGNIDLACAAMGPRGDDVVLALLQRGIAVLCEHPVQAELVERAWSTGTPFDVNGHFARLDDPRAFIAAAQKRARPERVHAAIDPRLLYASLDIMRHAFGTLALPITWETNERQCRIVAAYEHETLELPHIDLDQDKRDAATLEAMDTVGQTPKEHLLDVSRATEEVARRWFSGARAEAGR